MSTDAAHTRPWEIGEVVFGVPLLVAVVLHFIAPLAFLPPGLTPVLWLIGGIFVALGVALISATRRELSKYAQPTDPGQPTRALVTTGVFSLSRNPMYLGVACFLLGLALVFRLTWLLALLLPTLIACHLILVAPEEHYLAAKFGADYGRYAASVRRWLGRKPHPEQGG